MKHLADGVKNINHCFVPGPHYMCTAPSIYGKHIKSLSVENLECQPHETRKFSLTTENPGWYKDLVENHDLLKKVHVMQCDHRKTITFELRHMVPLIEESRIAGTDEEASLFALFKAAALLETQRGDLDERLRSDRNKEKKRLESRMKHDLTFGLPWETRLHLYGKYVFEVRSSLILTIFFNKHKAWGHESIEVGGTTRKGIWKNPRCISGVQSPFRCLVGTEKC
jgi:hypothetical protein